MAERFNRAFLSHSSADKDFVRQVFEILGPMRAEYDEVTFDYTFNVQAIRDALARSSIFVYFLSEKSTSSTFVDEERKAALEARGKGIIKRVLVFTLDDSSYRSLPAWMQELNVVQRLSSPKACARRIVAQLLEEDATRSDNNAIYLGRDDDEKTLRKALTVTPSAIPLALHVVGHHGIGRRTFLRNSLGKLLPRHYSVLAEMSLAKHEGVEEFYRAIYSLNSVSSLSETVEEFSQFGGLPIHEQVAKIVALAEEMISNGEFILVFDDGGFYTEDGDYQPFFTDILKSLNHHKRPLFGIAQTRMMPQRQRPSHGRSFHQFLQPLDQESTKEIIAFALQELEIDYLEAQLADIVELVDGHPFNIRFAIQFIVNYGIHSLLSDPGDLISWKQRRAEDYLSGVEFSDLECDIVAALTDYRHIAAGMISDVLAADPVETSRALRRLQEFCCVELRESYFHISSPIRDAVTKDRRFDRSTEWRRKIAAAVCDTVKDYMDEDRVSVSIIETATVAAARGEVEAPPLLSYLILPSHLLRIARDHYEDRRWGRCQEFALRAYDARQRLPQDAQVEALRLTGLSAIRTDDRAAFDFVLAQLSEQPGNHSKRIREFLLGFHHRVAGGLDDAEPHFIRAWQFARKNESINRELASLYCKQGRYSDAEPYARAAYNNSPNSPYILDIMAEMLLGKQQFGGVVDQTELRKILRDLEYYGDAPGSSFYLNRLAQEKLKDGDRRGALDSINRAIERTPSLLPPYFMRADIRLALNDVPGAESDLKKINELLSQAGGFSEGDEARAAELEVRILIERGNYPFAKTKIEKSAFLPRYVQNRLLDKLAKAIFYKPTGVSKDLIDWSKRRLSK